MHRQTGFIRAVLWLALVSLLTGCGGGGNDATGTSTAGTAATSAATPQLVPSATPDATVSIPTYAGPYGAPTPVTYTGLDGKSLTVDAFPGQIIVEAASVDTPSATIASLVQGLGGTVVDETGMGVYLAVFPAGSEAQIIAALKQSPNVYDALPNSPANTQAPAQAQAQAAPGMTSGQIQIVGNARIDDHTSFYAVDYAKVIVSGQPLTHGEAVFDIATQGLTGGAGILLPPVASSDGQFVQNLVLYDIAKAFRKIAADAGTTRVVVNLSVGSNGIDPFSNQALEKHFLVNVVGYLDYAIALHTNMILVVSSSDGILNHGGGSDLRPVLEVIHERYKFICNGNLGGPRLFVVGSSGEPDNPIIDTTQNYSSDIDDVVNGPGDGTGLPLMVYKPGKKILLPGGNIIADGTSFSAPLLANDLLQLLHQYPDEDLEEVTCAVGRGQLVPAWVGTFTSFDGNHNQAPLGSGSMTLSFTNLNGPFNHIFARGRVKATGPLGGISSAEVVGRMRAPDATGNPTGFTPFASFNGTMLSPDAKHPSASLNFSRLTVTGNRLTLTDELDAGIPQRSFPLCYGNDFLNFHGVFDDDPIINALGLPTANAGESFAGVAQPAVDGKCSLRHLTTH
jgi:hypothetical protein